MRGDTSARLFGSAPMVLAGSYAAIVVVARGLGSPLDVLQLAAGYTLAIGSVVLFVAVLWWLGLLIRDARHGAHRPALAIGNEALAARWREDRFHSLWQPIALFVTVMTAFTLFKQTVLPRAGFVMGPAVADADRALFGQDAWRLTHGLLSSPWATQVIDMAYHAWFAPMTLGVALCVFARPGTLLAQRYLLAFALLWIVQGSLLAFRMPAAGPIYFEYFQVEASRFAGLSARLADQDAFLRAAGAPGLAALGYQEHLLRLFGAHAVALGGGISAMPSLHNALAVLIVCAGRHLSRRLGWALAGYSLLIWVGSVQLGWHYALDGIVALAATMATWKATGLFYQVLPRAAPLATIEAAPASIS